MSVQRSRRLSRLPAAACLAGLAALGACSGGPEIPPPSFATSEANSLDRTYRLGVGDKLRITVFGEDNISGQYEINALGQVPVPLVGEVAAAGLPITGFRDSLARRLADGFLKNPKVTVEVLNYRAIYVHGEVKQGGEFPYKTGLRLRDAIAMAGGYTYRANESYVVIAREGAGEGQVSTSGNVVVLPGDNIRIPERFF